MQIRRPLAAVCLTLAFAACSSRTKPEVHVAPQGVGLKTELIEAGASPREQLRYARAPGLTENLVIELSLASFIEASTAAVAVQAPMLALGLTTGAVDKVSEGVWRYPFAFKVIGVKMPEGAAPADIEELSRAVAPLGAVTGTYEIDERGLTRRADIVVPPHVSPRLVTLLGNVRSSLITVPLPEEDVGVGARWKVQRLHQVGSIATTQTVTYSLLERKERLLRLGVTLQQTAAPQEVPFEDGTVVQVEAYEVSGTGSMLMNLDAITPLGELRGTSDLRGLLKHGAESEPLQASGAVEILISPVGKSAPELSGDGSAG
jgi:hypothetical protein